MSEETSERVRAREHLEGISGDKAGKDCIYFPPLFTAESDFEVYTRIKVCDLS